MLVRFPEISTFGSDSLRYDAANRCVYVACGDDAKTGAIATIDAVTNPINLEIADLTRCLRARPR
jgi:hypothetical protein